MGKIKYLAACTGFLLLIFTQTIHAQVSLQPAGILLKDVIITSKTAESQLMKIDLTRVPANTAQDLLRKVPGLFIAQHAGGGKAEQIFLRGFDNDHGTDIAISADGIPVNMVSHAHGQGYSDLHFLIPETIDNITFGKGAYYADKGDFNTSGYVDFHTYDQVSNSMIKLEGGNFNTLRTAGIFNLLPGDQHQRNAYIAGEYNFTNGPFQVKQNFNRFNLFGKFNQQINEKSYINIQASTFSSSWNASGQIPERAVTEGIIGRFDSIDTTEGGNTSRTNLLLNYRYKIDDQQNWESSFYYSRYKFNLYSDFTFYLVHPDKGDEIHQFDNRDVYGMNHKYSKRFEFGTSSLIWQAGGGFRTDVIHDLGLSYVTARDTLNERLAWGNGTETNVNVFTSAEWMIGKWMINPGLRADWFNFNYFDKLDTRNGIQGYQKIRVSPKFNVFYNIDANTQLYLKTGFGFHSNDMRDVILQKGVNTLPWSAGTDLGILLKPVKDLVIQPILWYTYLSNEYVWNGDSYGTSAVGPTRRYGFDLALRYQPLHWLYLDADGNYADPRLVGKPVGNNYVELAPTFTSTGGIGVQLKNGLSANLRYRYMHNRPATQDNSIVANGYFVNDLLLGYEKKSWAFNIQVQNLFDVNWNEAMFAETTRLHGEPSAGVEQLTFTPGTPFYIKAGVTVKF
ncbi:TonB-dependent receptor [Pedobacter cryoconitis]|uniref:Outer membrane receptor for Fe3+-dicitrate n=1 Tax=Pedobacter cryoconitis TaxID=188932 RepID=A0A7X0J726_9SPHI|nr:TonB-dependent receptor plug domain-containing protein [Pedobacter cryoconitis]MBB6501057.1 outer membrane receptor for Fe3+-dicitrate [Pedobacter cryoconitis]